MFAMADILNACLLLVVDRDGLHFINEFSRSWARTEWIRRWVLQKNEAHFPVEMALLGRSCFGFFAHFPSWMPWNEPSVFFCLIFVSQGGGLCFTSGLREMMSSNQWLTTMRQNEWLLLSMVPLKRSSWGWKTNVVQTDFYSLLLEIKPRAASRPGKGSACMLHPVTDETLRKLPIHGFLGGAHTCGRLIVQLGMVLPKASVQKAWFPVWCHWEMVAPSGGRAGRGL